MSKAEVEKWLEATPRVFELSHARLMEIAAAIISMTDSFDLFIGAGNAFTELHDWELRELVRLANEYSSERPER